MTNQNGNEKKTLRFSKELLERDRDKTEEICEINLSTGLANVVASSDAPVLTPELLTEVASPIRDGEIIFEGQKMVIGIFHGMPMATEFAMQEIRAEYQDRELTVKDEIERERRIAELIVAYMTADPIFSYKGQPADGYPVEELSNYLLRAFFAEYVEKNNLTDDEIYQVKVRRNKPDHWTQRVLDIHEKHPLAADAEAENALTLFVERAKAQRAMYVSEMIADPLLSLGDEGEGYPLANLSERMMQCLDSAYKAIHDPTERRRQVLSN